MAGLLVLLILTGLFLWLIWYLFFRSLLWVAEPSIEYFENREVEKFTIEDDSGIKAKVSLEGFDKPVHLPKSILQKAQKEPQKISKTNFWIYKDYIFPSKPTEEKIKEVFKE